jgi:hypothetical protein
MIAKKNATKKAKSAKAKSAKAKPAKAKSAKTKSAVKSKARTKSKGRAKAKKSAVKKAKPAKSKTAKTASSTAKKGKPKPPAERTAKRQPAKAQPAKTPPVNTPASTTPTIPAPQPASAPANPQATAPSDFQVEGTNANALFTLKVHRGVGMTLLAMNWKSGQPPQNFVGFAIEYQPPGASQFFALKNRVGFLDASGNVDPTALSTLQSPIQKFRWVHFPLDASLIGKFNYRITPMFMDSNNKLSGGETQLASIELASETYPGIANVTFTRGFISSQAFVDDYIKDGPINTLVAPSAKKGLDFKSTHPDSVKALAWMGFKARPAILGTLDAAIADNTAKVRVVAYDFNLPEIVDRLVKLGNRLKIIIDDSKGHGGPGTAETEAEGRLVTSAGRSNVKRQHMGSLQHNKTITVDGTSVKRVVCGSTNLSWRGFFVQSNNALILTGQTAVKLFSDAFDNYFDDAKPNDVAGFGAKPSANWNDLGLPGIDAKVAFSPHSAANAKLDEIATDIKSKTTSSLLYSLAFLYEVPGAVRDAIEAATADKDVFVYGISDKEVKGEFGGVNVQDPSGNVAPVFATELAANVPEPFKSEPSGGTGTRMHHKFTVHDFDKPTARVYLGSYNFSVPADRENGENLLIIRDRRIAVAYMIEALSLFDHYSFRVAVKKSATKGEKLHLSRPPRASGEKPWWDDDYTVAHKIKDRELFS